jgi:hypothetical protein
MISLTKNNYARQIGSGPTFKMEFDPLPKADNLYKESILAAEEIYDLKQGSLNVFYSGGVDSEFVLSLFLELGMDVTPVIIKLSDYNTHDLEYAFKFCESKNITPSVIDVNFDNFVKTGRFLEIAIETKSSVYQRPATCHALGLVDGTILLADGDPYMRPDANKIWNLEFDEHEFAYWNYFQNHNLYGTPSFMRFTPGMFSAYLTDLRWKELAQNLHYGKLGSNSSKIYALNRHSPFKLEPRTKYHGYELIEQSDIFKHEDFKTLLSLGKDYSGSHVINYHEFIKEYIDNV